MRLNLYNAGNIQGLAWRGNEDVVELPLVDLDVLDGTLEQGDDGANARINPAVAGLAAGLDFVGCRFVAVHAVGHAADDGILVGLLRRFGEQLADSNAGR